MKSQQRARGRGGIELPLREKKVLSCFLTKIASVSILSINSDFSSVM